jgi:hypothetical protein
VRLSRLRGNRHVRSGLEVVPWYLWPWVYAELMPMAASLDLGCDGAADDTGL